MPRWNKYVTIKTLDMSKGKGYLLSCFEDKTMKQVVERKESQARKVENFITLNASWSTQSFIAEEVSR